MLRLISWGAQPMVRPGRSGALYVMLYYTLHYIIILCHSMLCYTQFTQTRRTTPPPNVASRFTRHIPCAPLFVWIDWRMHGCGSKPKAKDSIV